MRQTGWIRTVQGYSSIPNFGDSQMFFFIMAMRRALKNYKTINGVVESYEPCYLLVYLCLQHNISTDWNDCIAWQPTALWYQFVFISIGNSMSARQLIIGLQVRKQTPLNHLSGGMAFTLRALLSLNFKRNGVNDLLDTYLNRSCRRPVE